MIFLSRTWRGERVYRGARGQIVLVAFVVLAVLLTLAALLIGSVGLYVTTARAAVADEQALSLAEGGMDEAIYQLNQNVLYSGEGDVKLSGGTFTTTVENLDANTRRITSTGSMPFGDRVARRTVVATASKNTSSVSFRYGVEVGAGGVLLDNSSTVEGNLFSNGDIVGSGSSGEGVVTGDATAGGGASISGVVVQGSAWAHALANCVIGGNASYQSISNCSVGGASHAGEADAATGTFPIADAEVARWESAAAAGSVIAGPHTVANNKTETLGPAKIEGDLAVNGTLSLAGPVWVAGNVTFGVGSTLVVAAGVGADSAVMIADVPGSTATAGTAYFANGMTIKGNGTPGSYPMVLSTNTGSAVSLNNNAESVIIYAAHGTVTLGNNASANAVTAYRLHLSNNGVVKYVSDLARQTFFDGPGGSWEFVPGTYGRVP